MVCFYRVIYRLSVRRSDYLGVCGSEPVDVYRLPAVRRCCRGALGMSRCVVSIWPNVWAAEAPMPGMTCW